VRGGRRGRRRRGGLPGCRGHLAVAAWPTSITGTPALAVGSVFTFTYGTSGVDATYTLQTGSGFNFNQVPASVLGPNVDTYLEPDPPLTTPFLTQSIGAGSTTSQLVCNKPLVQPILHVVNLDSSDLTV
jgi:hypothetical protein